MEKGIYAWKLDFLIKEFQIKNPNTIPIIECSKDFTEGLCRELGLDIEELRGVQKSQKYLGLYKGVSLHESTRPDIEVLIRAKEFFTPRDLRMYILVNEELKMSKGKVAAQVGHAVNVLVYNMLKGKKHEIDLLEEYMEGEIKKIILSAPERLLIELEEQGYCSIRDKGYTETKPDSLTCVNLGIIDKNQLPATSLINFLKLYK